MTPSRRLMSPRERQSKRSGSSSPYTSAHSMLTRTRARYNRELEPPLVPPLALLPPTSSSTTHCDKRVSPSHGSFRPSEDSMLELESSLDLLPPIASSTTHILSVIDQHHGDIDSFADAIKNMVLESHKELDRSIRQEISTRDSQIKEEQRWAEKNIELAKEQDARMHELELHCEKKELASRQTLEKCQVQLDVLRRRIKDSRFAREQEHRCPICIDLAWNPHVLPCGHMFCARCISQVKFTALQSLELCRCPICRARISQKPAPSLTIRQGVESIANAQGVIAPPLYRLQWPVRTSWPVRS